MCVCVCVRVCVSEKELDEHVCVYDESVHETAGSQRRGVLKQLLVVAIYCFIVVRVLLFYVYEKKYKEGERCKKREEK